MTPSNNTYDVVIIGGGIIGLSTGMALGQRYPHASVVILEKEERLAAHQTGNNSGVIHSGIYYKPGSFKARFCRGGAESMVEFCRRHNIDHEICGKIIVAIEPEEIPALDNLYQRGLENGIDVARVGPEEVRELEPHVLNSLGGVRVSAAGIVNFTQVCEKYAELIQAQGGEIRLNTRVESIHGNHQEKIVETNGDTVKAKVLINCGGLHSDRLAVLAKVDPKAKIVPFRGEYFVLKPEKRYLVKNLVYPVPNPDFPFLGVHLTRMIDGSIHAGPNAVLSLKREGYRKTDFSFKDFFETMTYPGIWRLAVKHGREGMKEIVRSLSKRAFTRSLQRLVPEIQIDDLLPTHAGVRAQALMRDGRLVDDFLIVKGERTVHVCNAPSPAATASIPIGNAIVDHVSDVLAADR